MRIEKNFLKIFHRKYSKVLKNLSIPHKKLLICFSGIPGSGKTYIAKILEKKYKGVRIRSDKIRKIVHESVKKNKKQPDNLDYINPLVKEYILWLIKNWPFKNKLIILDKGVDRNYKEIFSIAKNKKYQVFIIRLKSSRKVLERRILEKNNGRRDPHFDREIKRWTKEWKDFGKKVKSDIIIENEKDNELHLKPLFEKLNKLKN